MKNILHRIRMQCSRVNTAVCAAQGQNGGTLIMLFRPKEKEMWDTTLYEENGTYHLFYLSQGNIGHATTRDFVTFEEHEDICGFGGEGRWNQTGVPLTGCLQKVGESYKMLLGSIEPKEHKQVYGLYESCDLYNWTEYENNPVLMSDGIIYAKTVSPRDGNMFTAWRDPLVYEEKDGWYYICMCARTPRFDHSTTGALVANLRTRDFKSFEYLPPLDNVGDKVKYAECPDCFTLDGHRYITFLDHSWGGTRVHTSTRSDTAGTYYKVYNENTRRFEWLPDCLLIGASGDRQCSWAARSTMAEGKRLLYHHITAKRVGFAFPKEVKADSDGSLSLMYFDKMDNLLGESARLTNIGVENDLGVWSKKDNLYEGLCLGWGSALTVCENETDICVSVTTSMEKGARAGVALRANEKDPEYENGICVYFDYEKQQVCMEELGYRKFEGYGHFHFDVVNGGTVRNPDFKHMKLEYGKSYELKIFARNEFYEVYVNNVWVMTKAYEEVKTSGKVQLFTERAKADFRVSINRLLGTLN